MPAGDKYICSLNKSNFAPFTNINVSIMGSAMMTAKYTTQLATVAAPANVGRSLSLKIARKSRTIRKK